MAGWYVLNTDASMPDNSGEAAIGAVLRQKTRQNAPMTVIAYISKEVGQVKLQEAEYLALIEGLKLADKHNPIQPIFRSSSIQRSWPSKSTTRPRSSNT